MPRANGKDRVTRLLEMVVEEVSLVDRAANKHRFLIVKRSEGMDDTTTGSDPTETGLNAAGAPDVGGEATPDTGSDVGGDAQAVGASEPLAATITALEGLTEAVDLLAAQGDEASGPRLAELAGELQAAAEVLAESAGAQGCAAAGAAGSVAIGGSGGSTDTSDTGDTGQPAGTGQIAGPTGENPVTGPEPGAMPPAAAPTAAPAPDRVATAMAAVRDALGQVSAALAPASSSPMAKAAPGPSPGGAPGGAPGEAPGGTSGGTPSQIAAQLAQVARTLQTLTATVRAQQQRLARLEKRSGLPNSQPAGERAPGAGGGTGGSWPLDLNQPVDRESVDKAVSFHDL